MNAIAKRAGTEALVMASAGETTEENLPGGSKGRPARPQGKPTPQVYA